MKVKEVFALSVMILSLACGENPADKPVDDASHQTFSDAAIGDVAQLDAGQLEDAAQADDAAQEVDAGQIEDAAQNEDASASEDAGSTETAPAAPQNFQALLSSAVTAQFTWDDSSDNERGFLLDVSKSADFAVDSIWSVDADSEALEKNDLEPETDYYFRLRAYNDAGASAWSSVVSLHTLAFPYGTFQVSGGIVGTSGSTISLDSDMHGVDEMRYKLGDSAWGDWAAYAAQISVDVSAVADGRLDVSCEYRNSLGDVLARSDSIILDRTPPTVNRFVIDDDVWATGSRTMTLTCDVEGATRMRFQGDHSINPDAWEDFAPEKDWNLNLPNYTGSRRINAWFEDAYGNSAAVSDTIFYLPSDESISIQSGHSLVNAREVTLQLHSTTAAQMQFHNENTATWSALESYAETKSWTLSEGEGVKTVFVRFVDASSNQTEKSDDITLDQTAPVIVSFVIDDGAAASFDRQVEAALVATGGKWMSWSMNGSSWSPWQNVEEHFSVDLFAQGEEEANEDLEKIVHLRVRDFVGNIAETSDSIIFDGETRFLVTLDKIDVDYDGDALGEGEWLWWSGAYVGYSFRSAYYHGNILFSDSGGFSADGGHSYLLGNVYEFTIANGDDEYWTFGWRISEEDGSTTTHIGNIHYTYEYPYLGGDYSAYFSSSEGRGTAYWHVEKL